MFKCSEKSDVAEAATLRKDRFFLRNVSSSIIVSEIYGAAVKQDGHLQLDCFLFTFSVFSCTTNVCEIKLCVYCVSKIANSGVKVSFRNGRYAVLRMSLISYDLNADSGR